MYAPSVLPLKRLCSLSQNPKFGVYIIYIQTYCDAIIMLESESLAIITIRSKYVLPPI